LIDWRRFVAQAPPRQPGWLMLAAALPAVIATLAVVGLATIETGGYTPMSLQPANLAEAVGLGNAAETLRLLAYGESPYRVEPVRRELITSMEMRLTPLEAAIYSKKLELVRLLDSRGVIVDSGTRAALACLAVDIEAKDLAEYLSRGLDLKCEPGAALLTIARRMEPGRER
jgi:hypothetical protein